MAGTVKNRIPLAASRKHDRESVLLGDKLATLMRTAPANLAGQMAGARVRDCFAQAVIGLFGTAGAIFILQNVQAVYVRRDDTPRKASATGPAPILLEVCTTEAIIKTELDSRQEALKWRMRPLGVQFDVLKPVTSTWDMRYKKPFEARVAELRAQLEAAEGRIAAIEAAKAAGSDNSGTSPAAPASLWTPERIDATVADIESPALAEAIRRAMAASLL